MNEIEVVDITGTLHFIRISLNDDTDIIAEGDLQSNGFVACKKGCKKIKKGTDMKSSSIGSISENDMKKIMDSAARFLSRTHSNFSLTWVDF